MSNMAAKNQTQNHMDLIPLTTNSVLTLKPRSCLLCPLISWSHLHASHLHAIHSKLYQPLEIAFCWNLLLPLHNTQNLPSRSAPLGPFPLSSSSSFFRLSFWFTCLGTEWTPPKNDEEPLYLHQEHLWYYLNSSYIINLVFSSQLELLNEIYNLG